MHRLACLWFVLQGATFSLYQLPIWFRTPVLWLPTCEFRQTIVGLPHRLSTTTYYGRSALKPSRPISNILNWLVMLKLMQMDWLNNMTVSPALSPIFMPRWLPKGSSPSLWMTPDILASERHGRSLERLWCRNSTTLNRSRLTRQTPLCNREIWKAKPA